MNAVDLPEWHERWLHLIHSNDRALAAKASAAALRGGPRYDIEYRVVRPDGDVRIVRSQGDVTWDESGRPLRQFGVLQDITELRRAEHDLRASEARFRTFVDHAMDAFFLHDDQLKIIDVNRQACASLGYSREELVGMHPSDFDVGLDEATIERLRQRVLAGGTLTFETRHRRKDGTTFPLEIRAVQFEQGGSRVLCLARDITERKQAEDELRASEARFRTFVDHAADAFFLHDDQLTILDVNRQASVSLGYTREELIGMHPRDFDVGLDEASIERLRQRIAAAEILTFETRHRRKDGAVFPVEVRAAQFEQGGRRRHLTVVRDITERKQAEALLREREAKIRRLVDSNIIGIFIWKLQGQIVEANDAFLRIVGYDREDLVAGRLNRTELTPLEWRDLTDRARVELKMTGTIQPYEKEYFRKDGSRVPILFGAATLEGDEKQGVAFVLDLSDRKQCRAALKRETPDSMFSMALFCT